MFKIFARNKKTNAVQTIDAPAPVMTPEVIEAPMPNLCTMLIFAMADYIKQNEQVAGENVPAIVEVKAAYERLLKLGMKNTQNCRALEVQVEANKKAQYDKMMARSLIHFVKKAQEYFGPRTILISYTAFDELCEKYGLECGLLTDYCGVIPERNVQDIENVVSKIDTCNSEVIMRCLNKMPGMYDFHQYVVARKLNVPEKYEGKVVPFVKKSRNIFQLKNGNYQYISQFNFEKIHHNLFLGDDEWWVSFTGKLLKKDTLFIACPPKYLNDTGIEITKQPVDPAIFQYTPYGVLVHTIWGEEAEDVAFKEFMELNLRIAKS